MIDLQTVMNSEPKEYVVCLIDVLGTGERLRKWGRRDRNDSRTLGLIFDAIGPVLRVHGEFAKYLRTCEDGQTGKALAEVLPPDEIERYTLCTHWRPQTQWFGDTFVFYAPLYNARGDQSTVPVAYFLMASCVAMLDSLANGYAVRGALCVGEGLELGEHNFFGPPFEEAHRLESTVAEYPRVVVSSRTVDFIERVQRDGADDIIGQKMRGLARPCSALIDRDNDDQYVVDFLGRGVHDPTEGEELRQLTNGVRAAFKYVSSEWRRFQEAEKGSNEREKLAPRYERLREFMAARLPIWG